MSPAAQKALTGTLRNVLIFQGRTSHRAPGALGAGSFGVHILICHLNGSSFLWALYPFFYHFLLILLSQKGSSPAAQLSLCGRACGQGPMWESSGLCVLSPHSFPAGWSDSLSGFPGESAEASLRPVPIPIPEDQGSRSSAGGAGVAGWWQCPVVRSQTCSVKGVPCKCF